MVEIQDKILKDIKKLINELNKNRIQISDAYLFGSYAKNQHNK